MSWMSLISIVTEDLQRKPRLRAADFRRHNVRSAMAVALAIRRATFSSLLIV